MSDLKTKYYQDYSGGLNDTSSAREIQPDEASVLKNWDISYQGQLRKRLGLTLVGNNMGVSGIGALAAYLQSNGNKDLMCVETTSLRYLNGPVWDVLDNTFIAGHNFWLENIALKNRIYICNEDNDLRYWDRGSVALNACLTTVGVGTIPHGNVMRWHKNHLFHLNDVRVGASLYPHDIFWSNLGDPDTYDTTNNHTTIPGNGRLLTAIDLGDTLVLFKEHSIQYLSGWGSTSWKITASSSTVANLDEQVGIAGPYACTRVGNEVWFMDDQGQVRRIYQTDQDAFRKDIISKNIQSTLATMNKTNISKVIMWTHNDKVFVGIPTGTSSTPNVILIFDILAANRTGREAWTTYTGWSPYVFASYPTSTTPDLYIGDAITGKVYVHSGTTDNGVEIDADWQGKDDDFKAPERYKTYKFGYGSGQTGSNQTVEVYASIDNGPFAKLDSLNLIATGSKLGPTGSFLLGPTGNAKLLGSSLKQSKFFYSTGGGTVVGKSVRHRLKALTAQAVIVNGLSSHFKPRLLR